MIQNNRLRNQVLKSDLIIEFLELYHSEILINLKEKPLNFWHFNRQSYLRARHGGGCDSYEGHYWAASTFRTRLPVLKKLKKAMSSWKRWNLSRKKILLPHYYKCHCFTVMYVNVWQHSFFFFYILLKGCPVWCLSQNKQFPLHNKVHSPSLPLSSSLSLFF